MLMRADLVQLVVLERNLGGQSGNSGRMEMGDSRPCGQVQATDDRVATGKMGMPEDNARNPRRRV